MKENSVDNSSKIPSLPINKYRFLNLKNVIFIVSIFLFITVAVFSIKHVFGSKKAYNPPTSGKHSSLTTSLSTTLSLRVLGNQLVNGQGQPVQLVGVNISGAGDCIPIGRQPLGVLYPLTQTSAEQTVSSITAWHVNVVRITLNEDCWLGINGVNPTYSGKNYQQAIVNFVAMLHSSSIYAIVDLHTNAPGNYIASSQQVMADADHTLLFWKSVANIFKNDHAIMFEAYNEPHITPGNSQTSNTWQCWLIGCTIVETDENQNHPVSGAPTWKSTGMQEIVATIRQSGATNPVLLGGLNWSEDLSQILSYLPTDPQNQLVAAYHNYMTATSKNNPKYWDTTIAAVSQKMPVVTTEIGEKDGGISYNDEYMKWADAHRISYIPWAWGTSAAYGKLGLLGNIDGTPSSYGETFYNHFHALHTSSFVSSPDKMPTSLPISTSSSAISCLYAKHTCPSGFVCHIDASKPLPGMSGICIQKKE